MTFISDCCASLTKEIVLNLENYTYKHSGCSIYVCSISSMFSFDVICFLLSYYIGWKKNRLQLFVQIYEKRCLKGKNFDS